ncbi:thyrotropin receptor-like [Thalassophryne amazonica]|uniref:thyrotropin receptor-like n=1 Tax=Thalassophryne amazonica TaxID=390379 RepID=UPI001471132E|nr:thyrotropin receptor-like [Thalassophryne amazonica]
MPHSTTKVSPAELLLKRALRTKLDCICPPVRSQIMLSSQQEQSRRRSVTPQSFHACVMEALQQLTDQLTDVERKYLDSLLIILGNFNRANLSHKLYKYRQHITCPTRDANILDHCYTTIKNAYRSVPRAALGLSDHSLIHLIPTYRQKLKSAKPVVKMFGTVLPMGKTVPSLFEGMGLPEDLDELIALAIQTDGRLLDRPHRVAQQSDRRSATPLNRLSSSNHTGRVASSQRQSTHLSCSLLPDFFNPCEDMMGQGFLRVSVWVVRLLAVLTNLLVMVILLTSHRRLFVSCFLMANLAFADFCVGMYLLVIASVDLYTRSHYYDYAIIWQTGTGCILAGMLSVFASKFSVYTSTVISIQRWHTIFYAMRPHKKLQFHHAAVLILSGCLLCLTLALPPLVGVSSYQKVSLCLPMDTVTTAARIYVVSVLMANILAFIVMHLCYFHIYCMVHNPPYQSCRRDTRIAKRMTVLIFTNFLCLAPICFYSLSAALHQPLITITDFKVLLVLFYPLNCCVHPFFYAILTKSFHCDILMSLSRMGLCQHQAHLYRSQLVKNWLPQRDSPVSCM